MNHADKMLDDVVQDQLNHLAKYTLQATCCEISIVVIVKADGSVQMSSGAERPPQRKEVLEHQQQIVKALTLMADIIMEKYTRGECQLLVQERGGPTLPVRDRDDDESTVALSMEL